MFTVYGINNCDTVRKALKWFDEEGLDYGFVDFRKNGLEKPIAAKWIQTLGWESVINKRSTTWRNLGDLERKCLNDDTAVALVCVHPTLIKRPVIVYKGIFLQGFTEKTKSQIKGLVEHS